MKSATLEVKVDLGPVRELLEEFAQNAERQLAGPHHEDTFRPLQSLSIDHVMRCQLFAVWQNGRMFVAYLDRQHCEGFARMRTCWVAIAESGTVFERHELWAYASDLVAPVHLRPPSIPDQDYSRQRYTESQA